MRTDGADGAASGFMCPVCGGSLWERFEIDGQGSATAEPGGPRFQCRIGHRFEAAELWIEHCGARNQALQYAARALAENAALARRLATWTREQGNLEAAAALEREAAQEDQLFEQVRQMVEGLPAPGRGGSV